MLNLTDVKNGNVKVENNPYVFENSSKENENVKHSRFNLTNAVGEAFISDSDEDFEDDLLTAPFEVLAEFLSSLMAKDYKNAFLYCQQILQYEPNNEIVKEFQPLLHEKIKSEEASSVEDSEGSEESLGSNISESSTSYYSGANTEDEETDDSSVDSNINSDVEEKDDDN